MMIRLHWWKQYRNDGLQNYGDLLSLFLVKKLSRGIVFTTRDPINRYLKRLIKPFYIAIGSVIGSASGNAIVWGSGIIKRDEKVANADFKAVRGPKTRERLIELGYNVPEVYGDPAILLPKFYNKNTKKKYKIGVIPHFKDYDYTKTKMTENPNIKIINLLTKSVTKTTKEILECENIVSSSLHGIIVGHAYGIPSLWIKLSDKLSGDNVKYYDYFGSMSIDYPKPIECRAENLDEERIGSYLSEYKNILLPNKSILASRQKDLMDCCPFNK